MNSNAKRNTLSTWQADRIVKADRLQCLLIGTLLTVLTISNSFETVDWRTIVAIVLQAELLVIGLAGWCPVYWGVQLLPARERQKAENIIAPRKREFN